MKDERCETCRFGKQAGGFVSCRRFPPTSDGKGDMSVDRPPLLKRDDWCGEYKAK